MTLVPPTVIFSGETASVIRLLFTAASAPIGASSIIKMLKDRNFVLFIVFASDTMPSSISIKEPIELCFIFFYSPF